MRLAYLNVFLILSSWFLIIGCKPEKKNQEDIKTIEVHLSTMGNDVAFDQNAIQVPAYQAFRMSFKNDADHDSEITHNVAIVKKGMDQEVLKILNQEDYEYDETVNFFKNKDYFVGVSKVMLPQEGSAIEVPPLEPGYYTYICLMPGHGNVLNMRGKLYVRHSNSKKAKAYLEVLELKEEYKWEEDIPFPENNQFSQAKYDLGKKLFFDPILSKNNKISCATCHIPEKSFEDGKAKSIGIHGKPLDRSTPTVANLAWGELFFWDGRSPSLEHQALQPIQSNVEMNLPMIEMEKKLSDNKDYVDLFLKAFNQKPSKNLVGKALATFERMLVSKKSPFDIWIDGDGSAMSEEAVLGFKLFNEKARCASCHSGWRFTDDSFHDVGLRSKDIGRGKLLKNIEKMQFAFKTPSLRNVAMTAPYFHDGSVKNLDAVIEFYNRGGDVKRKSLAEDIQPLKLTKSEKKNLLAFLKTLSSEFSMDGL